MTKSLASATKTVESKFNGKRIVLVDTADAIEVMIRAEGGIIETDLSEMTDLLILKDSSKRGPKLSKEAGSLNAKGAKIQIIRDEDLISFCLPGPNDFIHLLKEGDSARISNLVAVSHQTAGRIVVDDADLRNIELESCDLRFVRFNRCNFQNSKLSAVNFSEVSGTNFAESELRNVHFYSARHCKFNGARMHKTNFGGETVARCDFSEAHVEKVSWGGIDFENCQFEGTSFKLVWIANKVKFSKCKFLKADLSGIDIFNTDFGNCDFSDSKLENARVIKSRLYRANLSGCNFQNANLALSDISESRIDNANFSGCNLSGTRVADVQGNANQFNAAIQDSLDIAAYAAGQSLKDLVKELNFCKTFEFCGTVEKDGIDVEISIESTSQWVVVPFNYEPIDYKLPFIYGAQTFKRQLDARSVEGAFQHLALVYHGFKLHPETVTAKASKNTIGSEELKRLVLKCWCEVFKIEPPSDEELKSLQAKRADEQSAFKKRLIDLLQKEEQGIKEFNSMSHAKKRRTPLKKLNLSGRNLSEVQMSAMDIRGAIFTNAILKQADLRQANAEGASFKNANLDDSDLRLIETDGADFTGASLRNANLRAAWLSKTCFKSADLSGANFAHSNIQGADFTGCDFTNIRFYNTPYNEKTLFPSGFKGSSGLKWCGQGLEPFQLQAVLESASGPLDFDSFLKRVELSIDKDRLQKAISMLKKESFQLFAQVNEDSVVGVVKSQTDPDLVYACQLTSSGKFCCGTQNLKPCGGLRGSLCKHLLVLLLGLTKAGQLDATLGDTWVRASLVNDPKLDKDAISETFLRYKGAEAGEIDWRPTETIPEDYYAF